MDQSALRSSDRGSVGRGTALVAVAVILGIIVLQATDDKESPLGSGSVRVTTTAPKSTSTVGKQAKKLRVLVLNASSKKGAAATLTQTLKDQEFDVLDPDDAPAQAKTVVYYKEGFEGGAGQVGQYVYPTGTSPPIEPLPAVPGFATGDATVIVVIGTE